MAAYKFHYMWRFMRDNKCPVDSNDITDDLICTICKRVLINPHYGACGCRYCLDCITGYLSDEDELCPGNKDECKEELMNIDDNVYFDAVINNRISKLVVKCPRQFCSFEDQLRRIEEHEKCCEEQPIECPFSIVGCKDTQLTYDNISEHLRTGNVSHTKGMMTFIDRLQNEIGSTNRDVIELRSEMRQMALEKEESRKVVKKQAKEIEHLKEELHTVKAELEVKENLDPEKVKLIEQLLRDKRTLGDENVWTKHENNRLKDTIKESQTLCAGLMREKIALQMEQCRDDEQERCHVERNAEFEKEHLRAFFERYQQRLVPPADCCGDVSLCQELDSWFRLFYVDQRLTDMKVKVDKQNEFIWRLDDWAAAVKAAQSGACRQLYSDEFWSYNNGYRMCLSLFPGGFGGGEGTHLGVFFHLVRGPFDSTLVWPFKHTVNVAIINQNTQTDHASYSVALEDSPDSPNRKRPRTDRNGGLGKSKLIGLGELASSPGLCKDDRIFIRCTVDLAKVDRGISPFGQWP